MNAAKGFKGVHFGAGMDAGPNAEHGLHEILLHLARVHGSRFALENDEGKKTTYFCGSPADIKAVYANGHRDARELLYPLIGGGLFSAGTSLEHERVKRIVSATFGKARTGDSAVALQEAVRGEIKRCMGREGGALSCNEMFHFTHSLSVAISCHFVLGANVPTTVVDAVARVLGAVRALLTPPDGSQKSGDPRAMLEGAKTELRTYVMEMIAEARLDRLRPIPLLCELSDRMLGEGYTDEDVFSELLSLLGSGLETTGATVFWALRELTKDAKALEALSTWIKKQAVPSAQFEERGTPLDHVICETLRLYPSGWVMYRKAARAIVLDDGDVIPEASIACVSPYVTHRLFADWDSPEVFNPSRFAGLRSDGQSAAQYRYFPFGGGIHRCVGARLAMASVSIILIELLRTYAISCKDSAEIYSISGLALEPKGDAKFTLAAA